MGAIGGQSIILFRATEAGKVSFHSLSRKACEESLISQLPLFITTSSIQNSQASAVYL